MVKYLSPWDDYGFINNHAFECRVNPEFCHTCGRQMVESIEATGRMSRKTGEPTFARYHSCPTWITGWRTYRLIRNWALPGYGHDSHDADNSLSERGYR